MAHPHKIYDGDPYFVIDPITRAITNRTNKKITLMQFDHNSERFTFEIPRMIEGHDMSLCDLIEVHYLNVDAATKVANSGIYEVKDAQIIGDDDKAVVVGSWLISQNATKLVGSLNFVVRCSCTAADGWFEYVWSTAIYSGITVSNGIYNSNAVVEQYSDVLEQWKIELEQLARVPGATKEEFDQLARDFNKYTQDTDDTITELDGRVEKIEENGGGSTTGGAKVFLSDEEPANPKDGDIHIKRIKVGEGGMPLPFVTEPQMRRYVDGKIPAVPYWAMQPNKPTYTAKEVGAATIDDINDAIAKLPTGGGAKEWRQLAFIDFSLEENQLTYFRWTELGGVTDIFMQINGAKNKGELDSGYILRINDIQVAGTFAPNVKNSGNVNYWWAHAYYDGLVWHPTKSTGTIGDNNTALATNTTAKPYTIKQNVGVAEKIQLDIAEIYKNIAGTWEIWVR